MKSITKYCLLLGFVLVSVFFLHSGWSNMEYFTMDELSTREQFVYDEKVVLVNNPDFFTTREILDASLDWLNKEDSLVESDIFGYNKYNEPLRFLYVAQYYSVSEDETEEKEETGVSHLVLQKYRANRWCDENDDGNLCPSRPSPRYTWGGKTRWEHLLAAAKERVDENDNKIDPPLIEIFREKYGHLSQ